MNKAKISKLLISWIKMEYKDECLDLEVDEDTGLYELEIDCGFSFAFEVAEEFGFDDRINGDEIEPNMSIWHVVDFIDEHI